MSQKYLQKNVNMFYINFTNKRKYVLYFTTNNLDINKYCW